MHQVLRPFFAALLLAAVPACACPAVYTPPPVAPKDPGHYAERQKDGRIYVFGDPKTEATFDKTQHLQISATFIGAGPSGETVVVEAKDKLPEMTDRLVGEFAKRYGVQLR